MWTIGLVFGIRTVGETVANIRFGQTSARVTHKLIGQAALDWNGGRWHGRRHRIIWASGLVAAIAAIVETITFPPIWYAAIVAAMEHPVMARWRGYICFVRWFRCRWTVFLIASILTVLIAI